MPSRPLPPRGPRGTCAAREPGQQDEEAFPAKLRSRRSSEANHKGGFPELRCNSCLEHAGVDVSPDLIGHMAQDVHADPWVRLCRAVVFPAVCVPGEGLCVGPGSLRSLVHLWEDASMCDGVGDAHGRPSLVPFGEDGVGVTHCRRKAPDNLRYEARLI